MKFKEICKQYFGESEGYNYEKALEELYELQSMFSEADTLFEKLNVSSNYKNIDSSLGNDLAKFRDQLDSLISSISYEISLNKSEQ